MSHKGISMIEEEISMLNNDLNRNPFDVPDNYFDQLPMTVQERCHAASKKTQRRVAMRPQLAFAAGFGAIALSVVSVFSLMDADTQRNSGQVGGASSGILNPYTKVLSSGGFLGNSLSGINAFTVGNKRNALIGSPDMSDIMMNQLAVENLSIDDILNAGF